MYLTNVHLYLLAINLGNFFIISFSCRSFHYEQYKLKRSNGCFLQSLFRVPTLPAFTSNRLAANTTTLPLAFSASLLEQFSLHLRLCLCEQTEKCVGYQSLFCFFRGFEVGGPDLLVYCTSILYHWCIMESENSTCCGTRVIGVEIRSVSACTSFRVTNSFARLRANPENVPQHVASWNWALYPFLLPSLHFATSDINILLFARVNRSKVAVLLICAATRRPMTQNIRCSEDYV